MNRVRVRAFQFAGIAILLCFGLGMLQAQEPAQSQAPANPSTSAQTPDKSQGAQKPEAEENPFAPEPAQPLPPGMTGSDVNDPRYKLSPGLYNAGETAMGIKHLLLLKKPDAFQLGTSNPDDPKVKQTIGQLGVGGGAADKMPREM